MAKRQAARPSASSSSYKVGNVYTSPPLSLDGTDGFARADLEFHGVDHSGASFEARVFVGNPSATAATPKTVGVGYAGSFHIFGHGGCFGDVGHCEIRAARRPYDPRPSHPLTPARKVVIATEVIRNALKKSEPLTVTVVPVITSATPRCDLQNVLQFDRVALVTYR
jgi:hypothetical protein